MMKIYLSQEKAQSSWGENALISAQAEAVFIHLPEKKENYLSLIQQAARKIKNLGIQDVSLEENWDTEERWAFYLGFDSVKNKGNIKGLNDHNEIDERLIATEFVKSLINSPSDQVTPITLAERAANFIYEQAEQMGLANAVSFEILCGEALLTEGYHGIWTVGKGSQNPPAMLKLEFNPTQDPNAPVLACLVGKGITFDTGGYSLKPSDAMSTMRTDMGGAALLTGALGYAISKGLTQRVQLYLCCAENMVSSNAFKLGDIITYRNGVSVEVLNTDAEGRLVLADGLIDASQQNAKFIIDAATLTGAAKVALGNDYHALLSMDEQLTQQFLAVAKQTGEAFWRLPFEELHRKQTASQFADIANVGSVPVGAGASTAAAFLSYFVENYSQNWLHIDCSATFRKTASELWGAGATGIGVRTVAEFLLSVK